MGNLDKTETLSLITVGDMTNVREVTETAFSVLQISLIYKYFNSSLSHSSFLEWKMILYAFVFLLSVCYTCLHKNGAKHGDISTHLHLGCKYIFSCVFFNLLLTRFSNRKLVIKMMNVGGGGGGVGWGERASTMGFRSITLELFEIF